MGSGGSALLPPVFCQKGGGSSGINIDNKRSFAAVGYPLFPAQSGSDGAKRPKEEHLRAEVEPCLAQ
eukprot:267364-Rhodomonas_salina.5